MKKIFGVCFLFMAGGGNHADHGAGDRDFR